jgi:hypothetical protein
MISSAERVTHMFACVRQRGDHALCCPSEREDRVVFLKLVNLVEERSAIGRIAERRFL